MSESIYQRNGTTLGIIGSGCRTGIGITGGWTSLGIKGSGVDLGVSMSETKFPYTGDGSLFHCEWSKNCVLGITELLTPVEHALAICNNIALITGLN